MVKRLKSERGTVLIELVFSCLILVIFFYACTEVFLLVRDKLYLQRIARDGAREAVIVGGSESAGTAKARARAQQFFGNRASKVDVEMKRYDGDRVHAVTCVVSYPHPVFGPLSEKIFGSREVTLSARATFGWRDLATGYE
ncbi:MAG: hypothetical protein HPY58_13015 [Firmicutes bacterium]|nr:hypothetical protein [Bacillota bacterium]